MPYFGSYFMDLLALAATAVAIGYAYIVWSFQYWKKRNIPYLEPRIPWGNMESVINKTTSMGEDMNTLYNKLKRQKRKYAGIYLLTAPHLLLLDLDLIKHVMTKDFHNFVDRGIYTNEKDDPLSAHLFSISGNKWKVLRTKLTPTFTSGKMKVMFNTLVECGMILENFIEQYVDDKEGVDIKDILGKFSTDIIGSCAFGLECDSFKNPNSPFRVYGKKIFDSSIFINIKEAFVDTFPNTARALKVTIVPKDVSDFFRKIVKDTISYRRENNYTRNDFLQLLINIMDNKIDIDEKHKGDGRTLTMDEVAAQSFVFFAAGFETSSTTMTFALYLMSLHQDVQEKVRKEISIVLDKHDGKITYDALLEMKYLKQVIDETLRLYAPLPFVTRVAAEDYKIPGEDVVLEKGTSVIIPMSGIHQDEEYYESPEVFDPDRFSEENIVGRHRYAHIPFGEGPRVCIGERFGIMQTKVGLISILRRYRVALNDKTKVPMKLSTSAFIPSAEGGVWINLEKVE